MNLYRLNKLLFFCIYLICTHPFILHSEKFEMKLTGGGLTKWEFFSDQVMGGKSKGNFQRITEGNINFVRLNGYVTTENNGGFIQIRSNVLNLSENIKGISLKVRGNGQRYYVFVRTTGTLLPWQYYRADFPTTSDWTHLNLDFEDFVRSSFWLKKMLSPSTIKSVGIVAFGRNHKAEVDLAEVSFF